MSEKHTRDLAGKAASRMVTCVQALRGIDDPEAWVDCAKRAINLLDLAMCDVRDAGERGNVISAGVERDYRRLKADLAKLNTPPAPHGGGISQDASGGIDRKGGE